jgi:predicted  nucleic acid-binding Zn-ribbon protein
MSIDTNIDNYTLADMEDFLDLPPDYTEGYVNMLIDSIPIYDEEKTRFIEEMRKRILNSMGVTDIAESKNAVNLPLKYENPYEKEAPNPFVTNEVSALICLNTRFILSDTNSYTTHDYTVNLTEKIQRVTSMRISNLNLPSTWYTIASENEGTIEFTKTQPDGEYTAKCIIPQGVYTISTLIDAINEKFSETHNEKNVLEYDVNTDKVKAIVTGVTTSSFLEINLESAKNDLIASESEKLLTEAQLVTLESELDGLQGKLDDLNLDLDGFKDELNTFQDTNDGLEDSTLTSELANITSVLNTQISTLKSHIFTLDTETSTLDTEISKLDTQISILETYTSTSDTYISTSGNVNAYITTLSGYKSELATIISGISTYIIEYSHETSSYNTTGYDSSLSTNTAKLQDISVPSIDGSIATSISSIASRLDDIVLTISGIASAIVDTGDGNSIKSRFNALSGKTASDLSELTTDLSNLISDSSTSDTGMESLTTDLSTLTTQLSELTTDLSNLISDDTSTSDPGLDSLTTDLSNLISDDTSTSDPGLDSLTTQLSTLEQQRRNAVYNGDEIVSIDIDITTKIGEITTKIGEITTKSEEITTKSEEITDKVAKITTKIGEITYKVAAIESKKATIESKTASITTKSTEIEDKLAEIEIKNKEITKMEDDITKKNVEIVNKKDKIGDREDDRIIKKTTVSDIEGLIASRRCKLDITIYSDQWGFRKPYRSIGRLLGFRTNSFTLYSGESPPFDYDLDGTKNVMIVVDDFTRNSYSGGLIATDAVITKAKIPEYVKDCECPPVESDRVIYASSKPGLTYHQLYTVNEIALNRLEPVPQLPPTPTEVLGVVPVYPGTTPYPITSSGGDISGGSRSYFGPVSISKLRIRLLDDGGEPLDIQNEDWLLTLSVSMLYQY